MIHVSIVCVVEIGDIPEHRTQCTLRCKIAQAFRLEKAYGDRHKYFKYCYKWGRITILGLSCCNSSSVETDASHVMRGNLEDADTCQVT